MPFPFIFGAAALGAAITGALKASAGMDKIQQAEAIGKLAQRNHEDAINLLRTDFKSTHKIAENYGLLNLEINRTTLKRYTNFIKNNRTKNKNKHIYISLLNISRNTKVKQFESTVVKADHLLSGGTAAAVTGVVASHSALALIGLFGTASTGTAISSLSGAAAWNATLASLGGGSLAVGGGGMALGSLMLGGITLGSSVMIGGFMLDLKGDEALKQARQYESKVNTAIIQIKSQRAFFERLRKRFNDLSNKVLYINKQINKLLDKLDKDPQKNITYNNDIRKLKILIKALKKIQNTSVLTHDGRLNTATEKIICSTFIPNIEAQEIRISRLKKLILAIVLLSALGVMPYLIIIKSDNKLKIQPHVNPLKSELLRH